jgi:hypothetical protein
MIVVSIPVAEVGRMLFKEQRPRLSNYFHLKRNKVILPQYAPILG